jgi:SNF2 family DNA or RNA helicase
MSWIHLCATPPFQHQIYGVEQIIKQPYFLLADEMGAGKSKQAIDAAQVLFVREEINKVIIITEASIRPVWYDPEFGELAKHLWPILAHRVVEYHSRLRVWNFGRSDETPMMWMVTNYDYIINEERLDELIEFTDKRTMLILDESSAIKNYRAQRTKACRLIRRKCGRVLLLNGTPIANSPLDMFSQGNMMHEDILECKGITHFKNRYAVMGGYVVQTRWGNHATQVVRWQNLEDLQNRFKPYTLRRLKKDCLDLPEKLPPVTLTATLKPETWKLYQEMKEDMVAWLGTGVATAYQMVVKILRLSQITSGFIGGIEAIDASTFEQPDFLPIEQPEKTREIGTEKLDVFLEWLDARLVEDPKFKLLTWCRFRPELDRLVRTLRGKYKTTAIESLHGGQKADDRERALRLLDPRTTVDGPGVVVATIGTGGKGHTFTAAHTVVNMSFDFSLEKYLQASDRVHRPGQTHPVSYFDIAAVGPKGQKTIDHQIIKSRRAKEDLAAWTTSAWIRALSEE